MATSMNPVELYHDPSLDGILGDYNVQRNSSNRRRATGQDRRSVSDYSSMPAPIPPAPEVPRGPPISYRSVGPADYGLQRSFSQRARGRPFAKEAFADDEDTPPTAQAPARLSQPTVQNPTLKRNQRQENGGLHLETRNLDGASAPRGKQSDLPPASAPVMRQISDRKHPARPGELHPHSAEPISAVSRSTTLRGFADDPNRDWAPDKSPLQKLEVTLNDISKEERRARVQEAELRLRESKAARSASQRINDRSAPAPTSAAPKVTSSRRQSESNYKQTDGESELVRNLSATHRNRLQHSTTIESRKPDTRRLSGEGHTGFDYSLSEPRENRLARQDPVFERRISAKQPQTVQSTSATGPSNIPPVISVQKRQGRTSAPGNYLPEAPVIAERGMNASHKAALAKLTGEVPPGMPTRSGSRKLQKAPPIKDNTQERQPTRQIDKGIPDTAIAMADESHDRHMQRQLDIDRSVVPRNRTPVGLGLQAPSVQSSPRSPQTQFEGTRQRQRKSSVSFKEPVNRRPVDEWKEAGTAKLSASDFSMEKPADMDSSKAWWEQDGTKKSRRRSKGIAGVSSSINQPDPVDDRMAEFKPRLYLRCGPLLRYTGMKRVRAESGTRANDREYWRGSVMIVTQDSQSSYEIPPVLRIFYQPKTLLPPPPDEITGEDLAPEYVDPIAGLTKMSRNGRALYVRPIDHLDEQKDLSQIESDDGLFESSPSPLDVDGNRNATSAATNRRTLDQDGERIGKYQEVSGARLYADPDRDVTFWRFNIEIELVDEQQHIAYRINRGPAVGFWVPARGQTMNIMFHSCNGFSLSVNPNMFSGPDPLWRDVLNTHQTRPFHVMIGGGDQIYNDRVMVETRHFAEWTKIRNPHHKHHAPFTMEMKEELESFYLNRYAMWFSQGLFGMAAGQIPMVNIWDDHDIIDGFGSYPDDFMRSPVFSGLGNIAFKYYMLFQHQSVPEETTTHEPSWILGHEPGPYIHQQSRHIFMQMGKHVAFLGLDCRTERMRDEVLSIQTLDHVLERCRKEIIEGETKHLIVLLGIPIAYPRLVWLENVLTSRAMDPIKALGRMGILKTGFLNKFDGGVEILDDLDDHWTASHHKRERNDLVKDLQDLAAEKSVRITILGGDVHLAAIGQFYSNPKLKIPKDRDHRYMPNVISSAIVNTPPPDMMADLMNKRDKTHHLDRYTDENMIPMFTHDVDMKKRNNKHLLPRRNWCSIREYIPGSTPPPTPPDTPSIADDDYEEVEDDHESLEPPKRRFSFTKEDVNPRALFRRLSSRNAPPTSYRDMMDPETNQIRSASFDGSRPVQSFGSHPGGSGSRADSLDSQPQRRASSFDHTSSGIPIRPGMFKRRPTNLSEKAAKKGNVPAIDAEGNEIDVNDQVNLEGGLDIVLNVEVNSKDPAGITMPYRLLVPALWYDGSSDREKLDEAESVVSRKPTLLNRFGIRGRQNHKAAQSQGAGNWGQDMSDTDSYDSDGQGKAPPPRRRFSLFGNRKSKKEEYYSDTESDVEGQHNQSGSEQQPPPQTAIPTDRRNQTADHAARSYQQPPSHPMTTDRLYDVGNRPTQPRPAPIRDHINSDKLYDSENPPPQRQSNKLSRVASDRLYDSENPPPPPPPKDQPIKRSLTIRSQNQGYQPNEPLSQTATSPYVSSGTRVVSQPLSRNPPIEQSPPLTDYEVQAGFNKPPDPRRRLSKQERILGIGDPSGTSYNDQPHPLRGNGIIGNPMYDLPSQPHPPSAYAAPPNSNRTQHGYDGIEAYQDPKPRRSWSLSRAKNWLEGRTDRSEKYY